MVRGMGIERAEEVLRETFGLESFRPWQAEAIGALLGEGAEDAGRHEVVVIAPTGGGKSLTYQLPAAMLPGTSVVVSPLIALMEDQVRSLEARGVRATYLASTLDIEERRRRERGLLAGEYQLVYVAPERIANPNTRGFLQRLSPPMVAIDEAHCIAEWGHDFRPDYLALGGLLELLQPRHVLACTATATPQVREEIIARLGLRDAHTVLRGFARPNLHLEVDTVDGAKARDGRIADALKAALGDDPSAPLGGAIVYTATRREAEAVQSKVAKLGYRTGCYHAGLSGEVRHEVGQAFAAGDLDVVAATNAFGMGIDRADIRLVIHWQSPGSIEAYYQEVGRAGRDGKLAHGILLSATKDFALRRFFAEAPAVPGGPPPPRETIDRKWSLFLDLMRYVEAGSCRHDFILRYFGDDEELLGGCGHCDVCERLEVEGADASEPRQVSEDDALVVRKALSGLARTHGRVGLRMVAEMLAGKDNAKIRRLDLHQLSTFGLLKQKGVDWNVALLRRLITAGYAVLSGDRYPVIGLTRRGVEVMKGEIPCAVFPPPATTKKRSSRRRDTVDEEPLPPEAEERFERLRAVRRARAEVQGVPAYVICTNRTLRGIARAAPQTLAALREVPGMGPARVAAHGLAFLEAVTG